MGVVYRALQVSVGRPVALKLVPHDPAGLTSSELLRLQREGRMLASALCGRSPFEGSTTSDLLATVQHAAPAWPDPSRVPRDVRIVLETCLEKWPQDRYADARDVEAELGRILRFEPIHASTPGKMRRLWRRLRRPSTRVVTIAAIGALAFNLLGEESFDEARALLTGAAERHGDSPEIVYRCACLERMTGHLALAEELEAQLEAMSNRDDAWTSMALGLKGDLQMDRGCTTDAIETFARLESSEPESAEWPWRRGKALIEAGRVAEAEAAVRRSLEIDPSRTDVLYTQGRVLRLLGRTWDALVAYERALALKPDWGQTYYWIADVWFDLGEPRVSLRYLREALARHPNWMDAWVLQAICQRDLGDLDAAIDSYPRALEERSHPPVRADRAEPLQRLGRDREALVEFERAIHDDPNLPTAWCGEGILRLDSEDPAIRDPFEATRLLQRALELDPDSAEYCDTLSRARRTIGLD